jgi:hypothetical protein
VFSITLIVTRSYFANFSKIYYLGFTGVRTNKKKQVMLGIYELKPMIDSNKQKEQNTNMDLIYG